jgi:DNA-binding response OmpR family regulator
MHQPFACEILCVEDNPGDFALIQHYLKKASLADYTLCQAQTLHAALDMLAQHAPHVILLDLKLPDAYGLNGLKKIKRAGYNIPIIILTGGSDESIAVEAIHNGAQDYLRKNEMNECSLQRAVQYALERHQFALQKQQMRQQQTALKMQMKSERRTRQLFTGIHHEFRTPLAIIQSSADLLYRHNPTPDSARNTTRIKTAVDRLVHIIDYMAIIARTSDGPPAAAERCWLRPTLMSAIDGLATSRITVEAFDDCTVAIAHDDLMEILQRIMENALDFSPEAAPVTVTVTRGQMP